MTAFCRRHRDQFDAVRAQFDLVGYPDQYRIELIEGGRRLASLRLLDGYRIELIDRSGK
jgi:hypothetical protein